VIWRFDDISGNTDTDKLARMVGAVSPVSDTIYLCVSPLYHANVGGRVFPAVFKAYSDIRAFYNVDYAWCPLTLPVVENAVVVSHGLLHIDHRLLNYQAQELSILTAAALTKSDVFVPPFNKYNQDTEAICEKAGIGLVKFEDGWKSAEHNKWDACHGLWYVHSWMWTVEKFMEWLR